MRNGKREMRNEEMKTRASRGLGRTSLSRALAAKLAGVVIATISTQQTALLFK